MIKRFITTLGLAATAMFIAVGTASAHVGFTADNTAAGGWAMLQFTVPHGCEGKGTTKIEIKLPEEYNFPYVTPFEANGWAASKTMRKLDKPMKAEHGDVAEVTDTIVYTRTGAALPDKIGSAMLVSLQWPADAAGTTLHLPIAQSCEGGASTLWNQIPAKGENHDSLESPAPFIMITKAATEGGHHGGAMHDASPSKGDGQDGHGSESANSRANIALVVGVLALLLGLVAVGRGRGGSKE